MFQNNNKAIVKKLTKRTLKTDKKRNFFIITAIMLTTLLISSAFSIGMSIMDSLQMQRIRLSGSVAHATVSNPTNEQMERLKELDYVKYVGTGIGVGRVQNTPKMGQIHINLTYVDGTQWEYMNTPAFSNINGQYPQNTDEIMLSLFALERMGITEPEIGMMIDLSYWIGNYNDIDSTVSNAFSLSGWFTNYYYVRSGGWDFALVAKDFAEQSGASLEASGSANIIFKDTRDIDSQIEKLKNDLYLNGNQTVTASAAYAIDFSSFVSTFAILITLSLLFMFTGVLLIYNVLYISVSRDIRFYGLLKTVGTTARQIRRIVIGLILRLCVVGIPIGLVLSALLSYFIVPGIISASDIATGTVISFSPVIYVGAAALALMTALIGASIPAKKAARITPVEAAKYNEGNVKRKQSSPVNGKPYKMAVRNIFRDSKRAVVVLISLSLGLAIFITVSAFLSSINIDKYADMEMKTDFRLDNKAPVIMAGANVFNDELLQSIQATPGLSKLQTFTETFCELDFISDDTTNTNSADTPTGFVYGVDKSVIDELNKTLTEPIDVEAFERGDFALIATKTPQNHQNTSKVTGTFIRGSSIIGTSFTIPVNGCVPREVIANGYVTNDSIIVVSNSYLHQVADWPQINYITVDVERGKDKEAFFYLNEMLKGENDISLTSKYQIKQSMRDDVAIVYVLGGGIALVLGLIGIMNFINIMSVGIMVRKRELAILESIGMESKKLRKMLVFEGLGYAVISLLIAILFGSGIAAGVCIPLAGQYEHIFFTYPLIPVIVTSLAIVGISVITPEMIYRSFSKATVVERLREAE